MKKSILFIVIFFLLATAFVVKGKPASQDQFQILYDKLTLIEAKIDSLTQCACNCPAEICDDTIDNDCDGYVDCTDSDCTSDPYCQQTCTPYDVQFCDTGEPGVCSDGHQTCDASGDFWGPCMRDVEPETEVCDGIDNDCDDYTDEETCNDGISCTIDACNNGTCSHDLMSGYCFITSNCYADGTQNPSNPCEECDPAVNQYDWTPVPGCGPELCDGIDNDGDGLIDEDFLLLGNACDGPDSDQCANGTYTCTSDGLGVECVNESPTNIQEVCDGIDNNCDGQTDEGGDLCPGGPPYCDNASSCQGYSEQGVCVNGSCTTNLIDDDSACSSSVEANTCGYYLSVYCNGQIDQTAPSCPTSCVTDSECDPEAYCDGTCQPDLPYGSTCDRNNQCLSDNCSGGTCGL